MNTERIEQLIERIKLEPHVKRDADSGFNMSKIFHPCGTPSCILGFTIAMFAPETDRDDAVSDTIETQKLGEILLEIDRETSEELFFPDNVYENFYMETITPKDAATALQNLLDEKPLWSHCYSPEDGE